MMKFRKMTSTIALKYKVSDESKAERHLFLCRHSDNDSAVTVANVPPFYNDENIENVLSRYVEEGKLVGCSTSRTLGSAEGYRVMVAKFESEMWLLKFLENVERADVVSFESFGLKTPLLGYKKYAVEYNDKFKPVELLRKQVESAVATYDDEVAAKRSQVVYGGKKVDDEGWTTVTMSSRHVFKAPKSIRKKMLQKKAADKLNPPASEEAFYAQNKKVIKNEESKNVHKKFEESKKKIAELRAKRRFNPMT